MTTIGSRIDTLHQLREEKRAKENEIKEIQAKIDLAEHELIAAMDSEGVLKSTGTKGTVAISEAVVPSVEDWDQFYEYIRRKKYFHLLERRPSVSGCRELFETKGIIPGVVPFVKRTLRLTSTS